MKESAPLWSFRGRHLNPHLEIVPGPGAYYPTDTTLLSSPKYKVGTSQRRPLADPNLTPGPGAYSPRSTLSAPSWSL